MAHRRDNLVPFRKPFGVSPSRSARLRPPPRRAGFGITPIMVTLPLAAFTAVFLFGIPGAASTPLPLSPPSQSAVPDRESARFALCDGPVRVNCVVDGDTFWYGGRKIRIADINAPEVGRPGCTREAELGEQATGRLLALLNQGAFTLAANDDGTGRDRDRYGRLLRTVTRNGASVGDVLVSEGLAEEWKGYRGSWC
jgi:endonuclease YncB( thermonuclease family)